MKSNIETTKRNTEIDLLRFIAAIAVLLYHYTYTFPQTDPTFPYHFGVSRIFKYGYLAVDLFFIISGYVLVMSAHGKTLEQFTRSRILRLYPVYWVSCILTYILILSSGNLGTHIPTVKFSHFLFNMTLLQEFFGRPDINPVYWSLAYELSFYFLVALIIMANAWEQIILLLAIWLGYTLLAGPMVTNNYLAFLLIPKYSAYFIAGMLFYLLRQQSFPAWKLYGLLAISYGLALRSAAQVRLRINDLYKDNFSLAVIFSLITCYYLIFLWIALYKPDLSRWKIFTKLGALTYPLYLVHLLGGALFYYAGGRGNKYLLLLGVTSIIILLAWLVQKLAGLRLPERKRFMFFGRAK